MDVTSAVLQACSSTIVLTALDMSSIKRMSAVALVQCAVNVRKACSCVSQRQQENGG